SANTVNVTWNGSRGGGGGGGGTGSCNGTSFSESLSASNTHTSHNANVTLTATSSPHTINTGCGIKIRDAGNGTTSYFVYNTCDTGDSSPCNQVVPWNSFGNPCASQGSGSCSYQAVVFVRGNYNKPDDA